MAELDESLACLDELVLTDVHLDDLAVELRLDHQLHLHRLHRKDRLTLLHSVSRLLVDLGDSARHGRLAESVGSAFKFNCFELIRGEPETDLVALLVEDVDHVVLDEVLLLAGLSVDDQLDDVGAELQNLVVVSLFSEDHCALLRAFS